MNSESNIEISNYQDNQFSESVQINTDFSSDTIDSENLKQLIKDNNEFINKKTGGSMNRDIPNLVFAKGVNLRKNQSGNLIFDFDDNFIDNSYNKTTSLDPAFFYKNEANDNNDDLDKKMEPESSSYEIYNSNNEILSDTSITQESNNKYTSETSVTDLAGGNSVTGTSLSGTSLSGTSLSGTSLSGTSLSGTSLSGTSLSETSLSETSIN